MNNKIAVVLVLANVKYSLNDLEKHYKTFCGLYLSQPFYDQRRISLSDISYSFEFWYLLIIATIKKWYQRRYHYR